MLFGQPSCGKDELNHPIFCEQRQMGTVNCLQFLWLQLSAPSMKGLPSFLLGFFLPTQKLNEVKQLTVLEGVVIPTPLPTFSSMLPTTPE